MRSVVIAIAAAIAIVGCDDTTKPAAVAGQYAMSSMNGKTAFPAPFDTADDLIFSLSDVTLTLNADGSYECGQVISYQRVSTGVVYMLIRSSAGSYSVQDVTIAFSAQTGTPPEKGTILAGGIQLFQSIQDGRQSDTLILKRRD